MVQGSSYRWTGQAVDWLRRVALQPIPIPQWRDVRAAVDQAQQVEAELPPDSLALRLLLALLTAFYFTTLVWAAATYYILGY